MQEHEAQDFILEYLLSKTGGDEDKIVSGYDIAQQFRGTAKEVIYTVLQRMATGNPPVFTAHIRNADIHSFEAFYQPNGFTKAFLDQGGFTKQFQDDEAMRLKKERSEALDEEIKRDSLRLNKDTFRMNRLNKIFLFINAAMAVFTLLWTIFKN
jgi:hypothetical protein